MNQLRNEPVIRAEGLSKFYGQVLGLSGVTLSMGPGITGLLGPNGAGKSTFLWLAAGQLKPTSGAMYVYGRELPGGPEVRRRIGICPEADAFYWDMTGRQFVAGLARLSGLNRRQAQIESQEWLRRVGLSDVMDRPIRTYSRGMRQRVKIAQALAGDPRLLLLDEPLSGADPVGRHELIALIRELAGQGRDVLVSSHVLPEIEALTDTVIVLHHGRLVAHGTVEAIRQMLDRYPHEVMIVCDRARELASQLLQYPDVVTCEVAEEQSLIVRTRDASVFYARLAGLLEAGRYHVEAIRAMNESLEAVFRYLSEKS